MPTQRINFNEWLPDQPNIVDGLADAKNVVPSITGYRPIQSVEDYSASASEDLTNATVSRYGATISIFAGGATKLFKFDSTDTSMDDVSKSGGYSGTGRWQFLQFGNSLLAANGTDRIQEWTLNTSTVFADLAANAPSAKYIAAVRDFVVGANMSTTEPNKVQWSDINNQGTWTSGGASQADYQIIPQGGDITGITGGEFGVILSERAITRMEYVGSPLFFSFSTISNNIGCVIEGTVARYGNNTFFYDESGFYMTDGSQVIPIGDEKVDNYFKNRAEPSKYSTVSCSVDPLAKIVVWNYETVDGDRELLIYNWSIQKWSRANTDADYITSLATTSVTLEALDTYSASIDALTVSLDSPLWSGGQYLFAGTRGDKVVTFSGAKKTAELKTNDFELGLNSVATLARPIVTNGSAKIEIASRKNLNDAITFSSQVTVDSEGRCSLRSAGRYHRVILTPTGDNWKNAVGVDIEFVQQGTR